MWAYHCPTRTLPSLSISLPLAVSRSLPGSCIFNPLSSSLSQGTRHVEQQLRFFFSFWGIRLFYDALAPTCCNRLRSTRLSLGIAPSPPPPKSVNHICHMRDFQHVIWRSPSSLISHSKSETEFETKSKIEFNSQNRQSVINGAIRLLAGA